MHSSSSRTDSRFNPAFFRVLQVLFLIAAFGASVKSQNSNTVLAKVAGREITQKEVDESILAQIFPLEQRVYAIRKTALENLITSAILEAEARQQGISVEELRKHLTAGDITVTLAQVEAAYSQNAPFFAAMSPDEVRERVRLDLETQARITNYKSALSRLKQKYRIEFLLEEPRLPMAADIDSPSRGSNTSAVTITEFSDFECPYCKSVQDTVKQVLQAYGAQVRLVFKHLPLEIHQGALPAAKAAVCAAAQNRFWEYHDSLFASSDYSATELENKAVRLGLDISRFNACLQSPETLATVVRDKQQAARLGIDSTPTFLVNGKLVRGAIKPEDLKSLIDRELRIAQSASHKQ